MAGMIEIPGGHGAAVPLRAGQRLRVVNTHGGQVVDTFAIDPADPTEHLSVEHTRRLLGRLFIRVGDDLVSNRRRPLLRLEADSWGGDHDMLCAACDPWLYRHYGVEGHHRSCSENFLTLLAGLGHQAGRVPQPLNLWMNVPVDAGNAMRLERPTSRPGDHVTFQALADVLVVLSACPMDISPVNGGDGTPQPVQYSVEG